MSAPLRRTWHPDGPGSWRSPDGLMGVTDKDGNRWVRRGGAFGRYWVGPDGVPLRWYRLVDQHGPLTEAQ